MEKAAFNKKMTIFASKLQQTQLQLINIIIIIIINEARFEVLSVVLMRNQVF
jgi:hypothetical protein